MEHEDQNIRNKVREWENGGRAYNSDQLFASLATYPAQRTSRPAAFYLAAAALVLSGALITYSLGETQRKAFELRMMEIELSLKQAEVIPQLVTITPPQEVACPVIEKPAKLRLLKTTRSPIIQQASLIKDEKTEVVPLATQQPDEVVVVPSETIVHQEPKATPRVILGSPVSLTDQSHSTRSRVSIRLFKSDPDQIESPKAATPVVTLAGINN